MRGHKSLSIRRGGKGFKPLADYIHFKGLKFGIHLMRGVPVKAVNEKTKILRRGVTAADIYSASNARG